MNDDDSGHKETDFSATSPVRAAKPKVPKSPAKAKKAHPESPSKAHRTPVKVPLTPGRASKAKIASASLTPKIHKGSPSKRPTSPSPSRKPRPPVCVPLSPGRESKLRTAGQPQSPKRQVSSPRKQRSPSPSRLQSPKRQLSSPRKQRSPSPHRRSPSRRKTPLSPSQPSPGKALREPASPLLRTKSPRSTSPRKSKELSSYAKKEPKQKRPSSPTSLRSPFQNKGKYLVLDDEDKNSKRKKASLLETTLSQQHAPATFSVEDESVLITPTRKSAEPVGNKDRGIKDEVMHLDLENLESASSTRSKYNSTSVRPKSGDVRVANGTKARVDKSSDTNLGQASLPTISNRESDIAASVTNKITTSNQQPSVTKNVPTAHRETCVNSNEQDPEVGETDNTSRKIAPSGEEIDKELNPKPAVRRTRLFCTLSIILLLLLVVAIVAPVLLLGGKNSKEPSKENRDSIGIKENIEATIGREALDETNSAYAQAMEWIVYDDPFELQPEDPTLHQRFILTYFFYATSSKGDWKYCTPPASIADSTSCIWEEENPFSPSPSKIEARRWLSASSECEWAGIQCDERGRISRLELAGFHLTGGFPEGLVHLPFLTAIDLKMNNLSGLLPASLNGLNMLQSLSLSDNFFTGVIPETWYDILSLEDIDISANQLKGSISSSIQKLRNLTKIDMYDNAFTGMIPPQLGKLTNLEALRLQQNELVGELPSQLGNLVDLAVLDVHGNDLSGTIPVELGRSGSLENFSLQNNKRLSGRVPGSILSNIYVLEAFNCNLSGDLTEKFLLMKNAITVRIHNNNFSGRLPSNTGAKMPNVEQLWISGNQFTGSVPDSICDLRSPFRLNELVADCGTSSFGERPEISCPVGCCTGCCDREGRGCLVG